MARSAATQARSTIVATVAMASVLSAFAGAARADELPAPLAKGEVATLIVDKKVNHVRKSDGSNQTWDFRSNGTVYWSTTSRTRGNSLGGTYTVGDDGMVCFKWNFDRYITLQDGCVLFRRDGDKVNVYGQRAPNAVYAVVTE